MSCSASKRESAVRLFAPALRACSASAELAKDHASGHGRVVRRGVLRHGGAPLSFKVRGNDDNRAVSAPSVAAVLASHLAANRKRGGRRGQAPLHGVRSAGIGAAGDDP